MPDDLDARLSALGAAPAPPLPGAAAARARAAQRSRRGRALLAGTGALLTVLAVLAGTTLASTEPAREADVLDVAPPTRAPVEHPVRAALLDPEDVDPLLAGSWTLRPLRDVPFPALPDDCSGSPFTTSAPQQGDAGTAQRHLDGSQDQVLAHAVLSYSDADRARSALARLRQALDSCPPGSGTVLTDVLEDPERPRSSADRLYGVLHDDPDAAGWVVERLDSVLSAVRLQPGARLADLPALADAAAAEVRASGVVRTPAPPPPAVDPALLLDAGDAERALGGAWEAFAPVAGSTFPLLLPCPDAPAALAGAHRSLAGPDDRSALSQVLRYPDDAAARAAVERVRADVLRCPSREQDSGDGTVEHALLPGGEAALLVRRTQPDFADVAAVLQVGDAVALVVAADQQAVEALAAAARERLGG